MNQQQRKWVEDYCNRIISPDEFKAFEEALLADAKFRKSARSYLAMDSHLRQGEENIQLIIDAWAEPKPKLALRMLPWLALTTAIALFLGYGLTLLFQKPDSSTTTEASIANVVSEDEVATITHSTNAVWGGEINLKQGDILSVGELILESGLAEIEVFCGTRILLEGPTKLDFVSVVQVICEYGKIRAHVPPHASGFRVDCKQFQLVDIGTEFGMEVNPSGKAKVYVFDGEVEIFDNVDSVVAEDMQVVAAGDGLAWDGIGAPPISHTSPPENYPSFDEIEAQKKEATTSRMTRWQKWSHQINSDPRLLVRYDFQQESPTLLDSSPSKLDGTVVGTERTRGRWSGKRALEFKRPSDRVRIDIPDSHDALTMMTWIRIDALPGHNQGLLLPDSYDNGRPHWVITKGGHMYFGARIPNAPDGTKIEKGYTALDVFNRNTIGTWICYGFVYDRHAKFAAHYVDGIEVARETLVNDQPLEIGAAAIGNWGLRPDLFADHEELQNLVGRMDDFAIWSASLTPTEIRECYEASRP